LKHFFSNVFSSMELPVIWDRLAENGVRQTLDDGSYSTHLQSLWDGHVIIRAVKLRTHNSLTTDDRWLTGVQRQPMTPAVNIGVGHGTFCDPTRRWIRSVSNSDINRQRPKSFSAVGTSANWLSERVGPENHTNPVLTATGFVNGKGQFSTPYKIDTPQPITKNLSQVITSATPTAVPNSVHICPQRLLGTWAKYN